MPIAYRPKVIVQQLGQLGQPKQRRRQRTVSNQPKITIVENNEQFLIYFGL